MGVGRDSRASCIQARREILAVRPATILLVWRRRFPFNLAQARLWFWTAVLSLVLLALVILSPATTAVDRIGLYLLPLQLVVFAHLPEVYGRPGRRNELYLGQREAIAAERRHDHHG